MRRRRLAVFPTGFSRDVTQPVPAVRPNPYSPLLPPEQRHVLPMGAITQQIAQYGSHELRSLPRGALSVAGKVLRSHEEPDGHGGKRLIIDEFEPTSIGINAAEGAT